MWASGPKSTYQPGCLVCALVLTVSSGDAQGGRVLHSVLRRAGAGRQRGDQHHVRIHGPSAINPTMAQRHSRPCNARRPPPAVHLPICVQLCSLLALLSLSSQEVSSSPRTSTRRCCDGMSAYLPPAAVVRECRTVTSRSRPRRQTSRRRSRRNRETRCARRS